MVGEGVRKVKGATSLGFVTFAKAIPAGVGRRMILSDEKKDQERLFFRVWQSSGEWIRT